METYHVKLSPKNIISVVRLTHIYNVAWFYLPQPNCISIVYWKITNPAVPTKIINLVTELSPDPTYLQLGSLISTDPDIYNLTLVSITVSTTSAGNPMR